MTKAWTIDKIIREQDAEIDALRAALAARDAVIAELADSAK